MNNKIRFRGEAQPVSSHIPLTSDTRLAPLLSMRPGSARDGAGTVEISGDDLVRVRFDNDLVMWLRADDLAADYGRVEVARDGGAPICEIVGPQVEPGERGLLKIGIRLLEFFGVDLAGKAAQSLGKKAETAILKNAPGLYRVPLDSDLHFSPVSAAQIQGLSGPILVFVHGTASSMTGSFSGLWETSAGLEARKAMHALYADRSFAFEHRSLSVSPIDNALELAQMLPSDAEIHLVSHSRGGLVSELMCLGSRTESATFDRPLDDGATLLDTLFSDDPAMGQELGLPRLFGAPAQAYQEARQQQRDQFRLLLKTLDDKRFKVSRFVRVACPARGTTLASGRLDRWLSVLNTIMEHSGLDTLAGGAVSDFLDFVLSVVKERTDPRSLPGLEAMMPGSPLIRLLNLPTLQVSADLSVIAGDVQGDSIWSRLKLLATDWFYGGEHDLVVNTPSMLGGARRPDHGARFERDQGASVNHFNYFKNEKTIRLLASGLTRTEGNLGGFRPISSASEHVPGLEKAIARSRSGSTPRPIAIMLPGTMGSALRVGSKDIWLHYRRLMFGGLGKLEFGQGAEPHSLLEGFYGPLVSFLSNSHRVEIFPYDWRHSVREAAGRLAENIEQLLPECERDVQPLRLVAHSMGGLVVRAFIAQRPELWARICALPDSRLIMLGTPNRGSHEAMRWLAGCNPTQKKLILLDLTRDRDEMIDVVRRYPGLLELLPSSGAPDFADGEVWKALKQELSESWSLPLASALREARKTWQLIEASPVDPQHMVYIAGCQDETVVDYRVQTGRRGQPELQFMATAEGDGTVPWSSGRLDEVAFYYVPGVAHDALCAASWAFPAYLELIENGRSARLSTSPPGNARGHRTGEIFPISDRPVTDSLPSEKEFMQPLLGLQAVLSGQSGTDRSAPPVRVSIRHGDLAYARYPVVVGHYLGDAIIGAERALDWRLDGKLSQQRALGLYPGAAGSHAVFLQADAQDQPPGALVLGLGQVGSLSPGALEQSARQALLEYAIKVADCPDSRFGALESVRCARLSFLLIGTGAGGLPLRESIHSLLRSVIAANQQLHESGLAKRVLIDEIEFVELLEDVAIGAARHLERVMADENLGRQLRWDRRVVEEGEGGRRRVMFESDDAWWQRMEIAHDARNGRLRFVPVTDRARAEEFVVAGQLKLADEFVSRACKSTARDSDAARTLFEMLLPNRLKEVSPEQRDMIVLLDNESARYPWEMLEDRWSGKRPPAVAAGYLRQLRTPRFRSQPLHAQGATAFVVGNPDLGASTTFSSLPGAEAEARAVAGLLSERGYSVRDSFAETADDVIGGLHADNWRILHMAGHGVHNFEAEDAVSGKKYVSGMVIGKNVFLTPGDIAQMRCVPELVFLNCCHLGSAEQAEGASVDFANLASNLAIEFIEMGVRAVVAAGWAVDDAAAKVFAERFYDQMMDGACFGDAVRSARERVWEGFPESNTWGAYQCYGDPAFSLRPGGGSARRSQTTSYYSVSQLICDLDSLRGAVRMQRNQGEVTAEKEQEALRRVGDLLARIPVTESWTERADVAAAIGYAYAEFENFEDATQWFDRALGSDIGYCDIRVLEQRANIGVRSAVEQWNALRKSSARVDPEAWVPLVERIERAVKALDALCAHAVTAERLSLLGSACKRLAWIQPEEEPRIEALTNMANYYLEASRQSPGQTYSVLNYVIAEMMRQWWTPRTRMSPEQKKELLERCDTAIKRMGEKNRLNPDFWSGAGLADARIALALVEDALDQQTGDELIGIYRRALERGASPRERASVVEQLEFVIEMAGSRPRSKAAGKRLATALQSICDVL